VKANHVISNIDIKTAIKLMDDCAVDEERVNRIEKMKVSSSFVMVYVGVKDDLRSYGLPPELGYFNSYDLDRMINKNSNATFGLGFPSLLDSSVVPKDCGNVVIHWPLCYSKDPVEISKDAICKMQIKNLNKIISLLPAMKNPTVSNLSKKGWCAIETIIDESVVRTLIPKLKQSGAQGIIEYPLNKVIY